MYSGFIVVHKPVGVTSHDVVSAVRRIAGLRKVGHTGTLDPFATGVLPVALGEGTKAIPFLDESVKEYRAVMRLGESTDTQDCTGNTVLRREWQHLTRTNIEVALRSFIGKGEQIPPMFSALKKEGVPLYKLARKGEVVPREPRAIEIYSLLIDYIDLPFVVFTVRSSRGVYVRTVANDIGNRLGCGAHLVELCRNASGPFTLGQSISLERLATDAQQGLFEDHLISCFAALDHLPVLNLTDSGVLRVSRGISPVETDFNDFEERALSPGEKVRLCRDRTVIAIAENCPATSSDGATALRLLRVFNEH